MIKGKKILAIVPARGGSKGVPGKNIKHLCGKPLITWTIEEAKKSTYIDKLIVSTDDKEIAEVAKQYGAEIPFLRPKALATDSATSNQVIKHAINYFKKKYTYVMYLQPTSPLRTVEHIDSAFNKIKKKSVKAIVSVCEVSHPVQWTGKLDNDLCMKKYISKKIQNVNRQDLEKYYRINGAIYISEIDYFIQNNGFLGKNTFAFIMDKNNSVDIDTAIDFELAGILLKDRFDGK